MYSDAFPAVSPYAAGKEKFLFFEGKDKQTNVIAKKTAGKASKKTEARQSTVHISYYRMVPIMPECNLLHYEDYLVGSRHAIRYKASFQGVIRLGEGLAHNWRLCSYDCFLLS